MTNTNNTHSDNQPGNGDADSDADGSGSGGLEWNKSSRDIMDKWRRSFYCSETYF